VVRSFRSKALRDFFLEEDARGVRPDLVERVRGRLQALHRAKSLDDLRVPGWRLHPLRSKPVAMRSPPTGHGGSRSNGWVATRYV
jgi:proteic killer suppression protein